jgi:hypothetical protein
MTTCGEVVWLLPSHPDHPGNRPATVRTRQILAGLMTPIPANLTSPATMRPTLKLAGMWPEWPTAAKTRPTGTGRQVVVDAAPVSPPGTTVTTEREGGKPMTDTEDGADGRHRPDRRTP